MITLSNTLACGTLTPLDDRSIRVGEACQSARAVEARHFALFEHIRHEKQSFG